MITMKYKDERKYRSLFASGYSLFLLIVSEVLFGVAPIIIS